MAKGPLRLRVDPVHVAEYASDQMMELDQLTLVRNEVRKGFEAHDHSTDGHRVEEIEVEVGWLNGDVETLVFDRLVGFPISPERDWYARWKAESGVGAW